MIKGSRLRRRGERKVRQTYCVKAGTIERVEKAHRWISHRGFERLGSDREEIDTLVPKERG